MKNERNKFQLNEIINDVLKRHQELASPFGSHMALKGLAKKIGLDNSWWQPQSGYFFDPEVGQGVGLDRLRGTYESLTETLIDGRIYFHVHQKEKEKYCAALERLKKIDDELGAGWHLIKAQSNVTGFELKEMVEKLKILSQVKKIELRVVAKRAYLYLVKPGTDIMPWYQHGWKEYLSMHVNKKIQKMKPEEGVKYSNLLKHYETCKGENLKLDGPLASLCAEEIKTYCEKHKLACEYWRKKDGKYVAYLWDEIVLKLKNLAEFKKLRNEAAKSLPEEKAVWGLRGWFRSWFHDEQENNLRNAIIHETEIRLKEEAKFIEDEEFELYSAMLDKLAWWETEQSSLDVVANCNNQLRRELFLPDIEFTDETLSEESVKEWIMKISQYMRDIRNKNIVYFDQLEKKCEKISAWPKHVSEKPIIDMKSIKELFPKISVGLTKTKELFAKCNHPDYRVEPLSNLFDPLSNIDENGELNYLSADYKDCKLADEVLRAFEQEKISQEEKLKKLESKKPGWGLVILGFQKNPIEREREALREEMINIAGKMKAQKTTMVKIRDSIINAEDKAYEKIKNLDLEKSNFQEIQTAYRFFVALKRRRPEKEIPFLIEAIAIVPELSGKMRNILFSPNLIKDSDIDFLILAFKKVGIEKRNFFHKLYLSELLPLWKNSIANQETKRAGFLKKILVHLSKVISPDCDILPHAPELNVIRSLIGIFSEDGFAEINDPIWIQLKYFAPYVSEIKIQADLDAFSAICGEAKKICEKWVKNGDFKKIDQYSKLLKPLFDVSEYAVEIADYKNYANPVRNAIGGIAPEIEKIYCKSEFTVNDIEKLKGYMANMLRDVCHDIDTPSSERILEEKVINKLIETIDEDLDVTFPEDKPLAEQQKYFQRFLQGPLEFFNDNKTNYRIADFSNISSDAAINKQVQAKLWNRLYNAKTQKEFDALWSVVPEFLKKNVFASFENLESKTWAEKLKMTKSGERTCPLFCFDPAKEELYKLIKEGTPKLRDSFEKESAAVARDVENKRQILNLLYKMKSKLETKKPLSLDEKKLLANIEGNGKTGLRAVNKQLVCEEGEFIEREKKLKIFLNKSADVHSVNDALNSPDLDSFLKGLTLQHLNLFFRQELNLFTIEEMTSLRRLMQGEQNLSRHSDSFFKAKRDDKRIANLQEAESNRPHSWGGDSHMEKQFRHK